MYINDQTERASTDVLRKAARLEVVYQLLNQDALDSINWSRLKIIHLIFIE
jgi:hypothetical protein